MTIKRFVVLGLCFLLSACEKASESPATSDAAGSAFVPTSDIAIDVYDNQIRLTSVSKQERLRLNGDDHLYVNADGESMPLTVLRDIFCDHLGRNCRYTYTYRIDFPVTVFGHYQEVDIQLQRSVDVSALNTVINVPLQPIYSAPAVNSTYSLSSDNIPISIYHASYADTYTISIIAADAGGLPCVKEYYSVPSGQNDFIISAGTLYQYTTNCLANVVQTRVTVSSLSEVTPDPALAFVKVHTSYADDGIDINFTP